VFFERYDHPLDLDADRTANVAAFEGVEPGAGAALERYLDSARTAYDLALRRFLYGTFQSRTALLRPDVVRHGPRLANLLTTSLESYIAARFLDPRLRQVLGYPAVFLGTSPDRAPSMYHLMSRLDLADGVLYPQGGFMRVADAVAGLARRSGARLHTGTTVTEITTGPRPGRRQRAAVTGVRYVDPSGAERTLTADLVVGAGDLHHLETRLLPESRRSYPEEYWDRRDPGPGAVLACVGVRGALPQLAHHSLFFTADWHRNFDAIFGKRRGVPDPASVYVCKPSQTDPSVAPAGCENLFLLVPVPPDVTLGRGGVDGRGDPVVEQVADAALAQQAVQVAPGQPAAPELAVEHPPVRDQEPRGAFEQMRDAGEAVEPRDAPVRGEHRDQRGRAGEIA
jgi:phytoene desaturase